jgi:glutathione synthase/RimK-type ligase-like ATP-grasp enzyme
VTRRLVLASFPALPAGDGDEAGLVDRLAAHGVEARWQPWGDAPEPDETVVIRATWDYTDDPERFLSWCAAVPRLVNPFPVVAANLDKRYLVRLAAAGVATIPTAVVEPGADLTPPAAEFVVKPVIGAGSRLVGRFAGADRDAAARHVEEIHGRAMAALVQPYQRAVDTAGETALVFLGGRYSHAFRKGPMLTGRRTLAANGAYLTEDLGPADPGPAERSLGERAIAATAADAGVAVADLAYARVDVVPGHDGRPLVLEVELVEPSLGFAFAGPEALDRFAAILAAHAGTRS